MTNSNYINYIPLNHNSCLQDKTACTLAITTYSNNLFILGILYTRLQRVRFWDVLFRLNCFHFSMK